MEEELGLLLRVLPTWVQEAIAASGASRIEEIAMDLGRPLALRYPDSHRIAERPVTKEDLHYIVHRVHGFREDNRTGIDRTVHRIACIRDRYGEIVGLTIRVGRAVEGAAEAIRDLLLDGQSLLFVGPPGCGKTTILRDAARILAERLGPKVIIVDTSNEIGGDGRIPHPGIGQARRIQVPEPSLQARILLQALANHGPLALVIDELGFHGDVEAAVTVARRGVQMLATAHGRTLRDLIENPDLAPLVGGISSGRVRRRLGSPVFPRVVEVRDRGNLLVHPDVAASVDRILRGEEPEGMDLRVKEVSRSPSDAAGLHTIMRGIGRNARILEILHSLSGSRDGAGRA